MNRNLIALALTAMSAGGADFSYVEKTEVTGGALKKMMSGFLARFAKGLNEPITTTHAYSGNKKSSVSAKSHEIWDASAETITSINADAKEYSVITFAEMAQLATAMAAQMSQAVQQGKAESPGVNARWKASFDKTGQTRQVAGVTGQGGTMKLELEGTDAKTGQTGVMKMDIDMYMGKLPGWEVKQAFDKSVGQKFGAQAGPQMQSMAMAGPAAMEAMKEAGRKMSELGEMQLASVMKTYSDAIPNMPADETGKSGTAKNSGPGAGQIVKEEATREAEYEAARRVGGRLGGLGGRLGGRLGQLGKKPKEEAPQPQPKPEASAAPAAPAGPGVLMEITTEVISFSSTVDQSAFVVPAGFKQVEHPMKKAYSKHVAK